MGKPGILARDSATRPEWQMYVDQVGNGAETALLALCVTARLVGGIDSRFRREVNAWPLKLFRFKRAS